jgi:tetratricopeptide (TPR) repeat protein
MTSRIAILTLTAALALPALARQAEPSATPPAGSASLNQAESFVAGGRYWEAMQIAQSVLASAPDDVRAKELEAEARAGLARVQKETLADAERRLAAGDLTDADRLELAGIFYENGGYVTAAELYAATPASMHTRETRLRHARALAWSGRTASAERIYGELLSADPDDEILLEYGRVLSWMGATKAATERLAGVYERTRSEEALIALANAHSWRGDRSTALQLLDDYLASHSTAVDARRLREEIAASPELRLERLDRAIEREPFNLALRVDRARHLIEMKRYGAALSDIEFVDEHAEKDPEGLDELRDEAKRRRGEAIAELRAQRASLDSENDPDRLLELARAYTGVEQYDEAIPLYRRYLEQRPNDLEARIQYARILSWDRRYSEAERQFARLVEENPDRLDLRLEHAKILAWDERFVRAVSEFREIKSLEDHPQIHLYGDVPSDARFNLGQIYRWFGWNEHALDEQRAAIDYDAGFAPARRELDLLRGLRPASNYDARYTHAENSNGFELDRFDLEVDHWTSQRTGWQLLLGRHEFADESEEVGSWAAGVGAQRRFSDRWRGNARVGANFYDDDLGTSPYWGLGAQWLAGLQSRLAFDYAHYDLVYDVFTVASLRNDPIDIDDFRIHYDHDTGGRWSWLADASTGFISDDNDRTALHGLLAFRLFKEPYVALKADYRNLAYDFRSDRYWSPNDYQSIAGVLHVGHHYRQRFFWDVELKYGRSFEDDRESDLRAIEGRVTVPINARFDLVAAYADGESGRFDSVVGNPEFVNYEQQRFYVGIRIKKRFMSNDREGERRYYYDESSIGESPVVPPEVQ